MADQQFCTFFVNHVYFGIDVQQVQEVIRPQPMTYLPLAPDHVCGLINLRGQIVTVIDLRQKLAMVGEVDILSGEEGGYNVVVECDGEIVSLMVDDIGDIVEFGVDRFTLPPGNLSGKIRQFLFGAYQLDVGFLLVLDVGAVINEQ